MIIPQRYSLDSGYTIVSPLGYAFYRHTYIITGK